VIGSDMQPTPTPASGTTVVLGNHDRRVIIRPIAPDDAGALVDFYARLSPEDRRQRFFHFHQVTADEGRRMAAIEDEGGVALIAVIDDGTLVADARCARRDDTVADLAIAVSDDYRGLGLGEMLLDRLVAAAAAIGITTITAEVVGDNLPMHRLLSKRHFMITGRDGSSIVDAIFSTDGRLPAWPVDTEGPRILVEAGSWFGSMQERYLRDAGFSVAVCPGSPPDGSCDLLATGSCRLAEGADVIISSAADEESRRVLAAHAAAPEATPLIVAIGPEQPPSIHRARAISRSATAQELLAALEAEGVRPPGNTDMKRE
jgi:RimJ/RimL family protein N-acetyltransferase